MPIFHKTSSNTSHLRSASSWVVLIAAVCITLLAWNISFRQVNSEAELRFDQRVEDIASAIVDRFEGYEQVMRGGVGLFAATANNVDRDAWQRYYASLNLEEHFPGILGLGYAQVVPPQDRDAHIRKIRAEGFPDYAIKPPGKRGLYTSIIFLEPFSGRNMRAFGYDMFSEPVRRAAMEHARDYAITTISGKVTLIQEPGKDPQAGFLSYLPVYMPGAALKTIAERRAALVGYVYSAYQVNELMGGIFDSDNLDVSFELYDGEETAAARLYGFTDARGLPRSVRPSFSASRVIDIHSRQWTLRVTSRPRFEAAIDYHRSTIILVGGLVFALLLFAIVRTLAASRNRAVAIARGMTRESRHNENRIRAVLDNTVDGIITISERGLIESINPAGERIFGYRAEELQGRNVNILIPEPHRSAHDNYIRNYLQSGNRKIIGTGREVMGRRKDGSVFPMDLAVNEVLLDGKRAFTGIARDITARKEAERELKETTALQRAILDSANYTIISTDEEGLILTFNRAAERMLGYTAAEVVGKVTPAIIHDPQEVAHRAKVLSAELGRIIEPGFEVFVTKARLGAPDETEWTYIRKDGSRFPVLLSATALHDQHDNITGFLSIGYDMTERKEMDRIKNEFISTVSHELRTPLTSIMGSLGLITSGISGSLPAQVASLLEIARKNAARLVRLINDILDIDKIESGNMRFDLRVQELMPLIVQAVEANRDYARQFGVELMVTCGLPGVRVEVDSDRLAQVLANLLSNAAKFSPRGANVTVGVERIEGYARITVTDRGPGISPEFKSKIFQKFSQADSSDSRQKEGSGLGLSITKAIIEHTGGRISFESEPGAGTTFLVDLPEATPSFIANATMDREAAADGRRVLICEDDHDVAKLLQLMLKEAGHPADISHDAEEAKRMLKQRAYAALTLDIALPGQDGIDLIRELRVENATRDLPIVVVSANAERGRQMLNGGIMIVDWLGKPIDQPRLLAALKQAVEPAFARPRILHVEDDPDILRIVGTLLEPHCEVDCAATVAAAKYALQHHHYNLVILDMLLPDGSGAELLPEIQGLEEPIPVVVFSVNEPKAEELSGKIAAALVKSRTTNDKLLQTIHRLTRRPEAVNNTATGVRV